MQTRCISVNARKAGGNALKLLAGFLVRQLIYMVDCFAVNNIANMLESAVFTSLTNLEYALLGTVKQ